MPILQKQGIRLLLLQSMNKIIIVTVKYIAHAEKIPGMETITIDNSPPLENRGFARGANIGIKKALTSGANKILLLNPDIKINKEQILKLSKNNADIVSPVLKTDGILDFGGKINWMMGRATHQKTDSGRGQNDAQKKIDAIASLQHDDAQTIDYVSGACMMIDKKVFEKIGFFDERFFMYFEDTDFCLRAKQAGFKISINTDITVDHLLSKNKLKNIYVLKSNFKFINKWVSWYFRPFAYIYLFWMWTKIRDAETLRPRSGRASSA